LIEGTMLVGLHTTWSAPQAKNPSYAPVYTLQCITTSLWLVTDPFIEAKWSVLQHS